MQSESQEEFAIEIVKLLSMTDVKCVVFFRREESRVVSLIRKVEPPCYNLFNRRPLLAQARNKTGYF